MATENPNGQISAVFGQHDGGGWSGDVVYYASKADAGTRSAKIFDTHGAARTPIVVADQALFVNELDIRAMACYESVGCGTFRSMATEASETRHPQPVTTPSVGVERGAVRNWSGRCPR